VFVELMPLLAGRTVMITVAREDENTLRLHIIPKKMKDDKYRPIGRLHLLVYQRVLGGQRQQSLEHAHRRLQVQRLSLSLHG